MRSTRSTCGGDPRWWSWPEASGGSFIGRRIAVLGPAFKPHSDDIRDSPALNVAAQARLQGADVVVTDPAALDTSATGTALAVMSRDAAAPIVLVGLWATG